VKLYALAVGAVSGLLFTANGLAGIVDVITNGSFETPVVSGEFQQFPNIPGWTGSAGIEIQVNGSLGAGQGTAFGNQYAELAVEQDSTYSQTITTVPGATYNLSFFFSARPTTGTNSVSVGFTGNSDASFSTPDTGKVNFQQFTHTFVATASQSVLSFTPTNTPHLGGGDLIDNVTLTTDSSDAPPSAVPVPAAIWTGMSGLLGLTSLGICRQLLRRKSHRG
jgi:hypothetical protein